MPSGPHLRARVLFFNQKLGEWAVQTCSSSSATRLVCPASPVMRLYTKIRSPMPLHIRRHCNSASLLLSPFSLIAEVTNHAASYVQPQLHVQLEGIVLTGIIRLHNLGTTRVHTEIRR